MTPTTTTTAPPTLHGEFVSLLPLGAEHAEITFAWRQGPRVRHLNRGATSVAAQAAWIASRPGSEFNFVIALKTASGRAPRPVGMLSLVGIDMTHRHAETARFLIGEEDAVRGVPAGVEAMQLLYALAFDELGLVRLHGSVAGDNLPMQKWQKYLGMREEGRWRQHYFLDGHFQDAVLFGLLEADYRRVALPRMRALMAAGRSQRRVAVAA